jgi:branched-chain amino acid transport system permease protein
MNPLAWTLKQRIERAIALGALVLVVVWPIGLSAYWSHEILVETFLFGIAAASLIFLSAYGGMVSLGQTALFGIAGVIVGNLATKGGPGGTSKGLHLGWDPTLAVVLGIAITTAIGLVFGAVAARSAGIYFLMITLTYSVIATYTLGQVTRISGFSGIGGINRYTPGWLGDVLAHPNRLYYVALGVALAVYALIRYLVRTPFGLTLQGVRDEPVRMGSLGYNVALHRTLAFGFAALLASLAGVLYVWWSGQIAPGNVDLPETINLLVMAVIGGLWRIEGAWLGAFAFIVIQNYVRDFHVPGLSFGGTLFGGSFNTVIGIIFLLIVLVSPGGLMGIWDRLLGGLEPIRRGRAALEVAPATSAESPSPVPQRRRASTP